MVLIKGMVSETDSAILPMFFPEADIELNLCWKTTFMYFTPFVWIMSDCYDLPIVQLSESDTLNFSIE